MNLYNSKIWIEYLENNFAECEYYFKFAMIWMSFNSFYSIKYSRISGERNKIKKFCEEYKYIYDRLIAENDNFGNILIDFKNTKYLDGSSDRECVASEINNNKFYFNNDNSSFLDFVNVVYQIRNNFFHGSKNVSNRYNKDLMKWAYGYFGIFWKKFIETND